MNLREEMERRGCGACEVTNKRFGWSGTYRCPDCPYKPDGRASWADTVRIAGEGKKAIITPYLPGWRRGQAGKVTITKDGREYEIDADSEELKELMELPRWPGIGEAKTWEETWRKRSQISFVAD